MKGVAGRIAIVTGGASGIGRALCEELARAQAVVVVADLNGDEASRVAQALTDEGGQASALPVDVASAESVRELVRTAVARHERIDLMFNNAGVGWAGDLRELDVAGSDRLVAINLNGVVYGTSAVYPIMVKQGAGHIINTASFLGLVPVPGQAVYAATKHAVVGFSLSLREEARMFGVNVSVVCPSWVRTNIQANSSVILRGRTDSAAPPLTKSTPEATRLARAILKSVSRNRSVVVTPASMRVLWWLYRASPRLFFAIHHPVFRRLMRRREASRAGGAAPSRVGGVARGPGRWLFKLLVGHDPGRPE
jgi:short-subunit dehydrogenase